MIQTAIWVPPSMCGCQLSITADFVDGSVIDGVSYRHPVPFTIQDIQIISVCDHHKSHMDAMPDVSWLFEHDEETGTATQRRGYLKYPIESPTGAECLYTFLCKLGGQSRSYPCGCKAFQFIDHDKKMKHVDHPHHTKKCRNHKHDTADMAKAASDFAVLVSATNLPKG